MIDRKKLAEDARYVADRYETDPTANYVARVLLAQLENPVTLIPEGYALVKKPELLGKGVPGGAY